MKRLQYTIREVPPEVDKVLRRKARERGESLNSILLKTLKMGAGIADKPTRKRNLSWFYGSGGIGRVEEAAFKVQRTIDPEKWR